VSQRRTRRCGHLHLVKSLARDKPSDVQRLLPRHTDMTLVFVRPQQKLGLTLTGEPLAADGHQPRPA
jgi:hypothetical protein